MLKEREIKQIIDLALASSKAEQTEAFLYSVDSATTRFADNHIHQSVAESNAILSVRVVFGKKIGIASTNSLSQGAILDLVERASTLARLQKENPDFTSLPKPLPIEKINCFSESTASYSPEQRAADVGMICRKAEGRGLRAFGAFSNITSQIAIANSLGILAYHLGTFAELSSVIGSETSSGYADRFAWEVKDLDVEAVAEEAIGKAISSKNPVTLEPGEYEVILEEYAVSDILDFLAYLGFNVRAVQEGRSFMCGNLGMRVLGENITIWDDGHSDSTIPMPFDCEGVPKQRVDLIVKGVANALCYDSYTAGKEGKTSTGHALFPGETMGPVPMNMFLKEGKASKEEMLSSTQRGIWVTRFHYTRPVHPSKLIITGMTRDGTFLVEKGEISYPVKNLRFTQSYLDALNSVELVGREAKLERSSFSFTRVPALKLGRFNFTGVTEF